MALEELYLLAALRAAAAGRSPGTPLPRAARSTRSGGFPQMNLEGDVSKLPRRDFALFSNQAAPQREEAIAKLLIVLKCLPWELGGTPVFVSRAQTGWDVLAAGRSRG